MPPIITGKRATARALAICALAAGLALAATARAQSCDAVQGAAARQRGDLARIVDCLNAPGCPAEIAREDPGAACRKTVHVWSRSAAGVVIRDLKMCFTPGVANDAGFLHGLAMPRGPVAGVEDDRLYAGDAGLDALWQFAWDAALARGMTSAEAMLVVNPPRNRSQNRLHIHIVRASGAPLPPTVDLPDLANVWRAAAEQAAARGIPCRDYGIVVHMSEGRFRMLVEAADPDPGVNPEGKYTLERR